MNKLKQWARWGILREEFYEFDMPFDRLRGRCL